MKNCADDTYPDAFVLVDSRPVDDQRVVRILVITPVSRRWKHDGHRRIAGDVAPRRLSDARAVKKSFSELDLDGDDMGPFGRHRDHIGERPAEKVPFDLTGLDGYGHGQTINPLRLRALATSPPGVIPDLFYRELMLSSPGPCQSPNTTSYDNGGNMTVRLGDIAPDFTADTTQGTIRFHEWLGDSWGVLFSHPKDFTPVCTTELGYVARIKPEFDKRNVKVIGLSVDPVDSHVRWEGDIAETQGTAVNFPMIGDPDRTVSDLYDMIHPNANDTLTVRSVFVIGPDKKIKLTITYPASTGRNFDEILRVIDSLQLTAAHKVATPANWTNGQDVIIGAAVSDEEAKQLFPQGWTTVKPYLRVLPQPKS